VAVGVVGAYRDERHAGAAGGEEVRVGVAAPVVRHLEDVRPQVGAVRHEPRLRLRAEVAGEQDPQAAHLHPDDQ